MRRSVATAQDGALRVWTPHGGVLAAVAPLALAASAGTALVVDLDPDGPRYPGARSLAGMVAEGPRRADLTPARRGVAVLRNGGVREDDATQVLEALAAGWPRLVMRHPPGEHPNGHGVVVVLPLVPGGLFPTSGPAVYQQGPWPMRRPPGAVVLPRPRASTVRSLLEGRRPAPSRWLRAWRTVWERPWA